MVAADVLPEAMDGLTVNLTKHPVGARVTPVLSDVEDLVIEPNSFDLVISCSCVEHVSDGHAFRETLTRIAAGTRPAGVNCFMINSDVAEMLSDGTFREPLIELNLSGSDVEEILAETYAGSTVADMSRKPWSCQETRDDESFMVKSTCIQFTGVRRA